ncbi:hypothetical protein D0Z00_001698 [Geotrichum galactomycetum]|uniref:Uncharacterized protein n=1 Tax=Geotrichum galactomycetum TaxID=27317 RepID=A0ACB6V654_9ASCO|nr:hypothetical protein D0Z00_001698 [Geotrichum candidum]
MFGTTQSAFGTPGGNGFGKPAGGLFGSTGNTASTGSSLFGGNNNTNAGSSTTGGGLFGNNSSGNNASGGLFGNASNTNNPASTGTGLFGNNNASSGGLFGKNTSNAAPSGGLFGNNNPSANTTTGGGLFGNSNNTGGLFNKPSTPSIGGAFGANNTATTGTSGGLFGANNNATPAATGGLFGAKPATPTTGGLFGNNNTSSAASNTGGSLFGNKSNTTTASTGGLFGGGQPAATGTGLFGNTTAPATGGLFGNANTAAPATGGLFGNKPATTTGGLFGNAGSTTLTGGLFGNNAGTNNTNNPAGSLLSNTTSSASNNALTLSNITPLPALTPAKKTPLRNSAANSVMKSSFSRVSKSRSLYHVSKQSPGFHISENPSYVNDTKDLFLKSVVSSQPKKPLFTSNLQSDPRRSDVKKLVIAKRTISSEDIRGVKRTKSESILNSINTSPVVTAATPVSSTKSALSPFPIDRVPASPQFKRVYEINKTALDEGYWIYPPLKEIFSYDFDQLANVKDLSIGRKNHGKIQYTVPVDLSEIRNLGDIMGNLVVFDGTTVCVYPDDSKKAPPGTALNVPAVVTLENVFIKHTVGNKIVTVTNHTNPKAVKQTQLLRKKIEEKGGEFITYDVTHGIIVFKVPHFSTWGFSELDLVYDEDEVEMELDDPEFQQSDSDEMDDDEDLVHKASIFKQYSDEQNLVIAEPDTTISDEIAFTETARSENWLEQLEYAEIIKLSTFATRSNGFPKAVFHNKINFQYLETSFASPEKELWSLASLLFDPISLLGLKPIPEGYNINKQIAKSTSPLSNAFIYLAGNSVTKAALAATQGKSPHLAALISLLGTDDVNIRKAAKSQLDTWSQTGSISYISKDIQNVYELLAGNANVETGVDLTWLQVFGLHLWYDSTVHKSLDEAVKRYIPISKNFTNSIEFELLKLVDSNTTPVNVLNFKNTWVSWALYVVLYKSLSLYSDDGEVIGDQISLDFALELEKAGHIVEAAFVICNISRDDLVQRYLQDLVSRQVDLLTDSVITELVSGLHIPEKIILEAIALNYRAKTDHTNECKALIDANDWNEAHKVLLHYVAPQCVIANDITTLYSILAKFSTNSSSNVDPKAWANGGQVYLDYALLYERIEPDQAKLSSDDESGEPFGKLAERFRRGLAAWQHDTDENFKVGVSRTLLESFSKKYIENRE